MSDVREAIIATYAEWTAMSALRSGAPIKSRRDVYTAMSGIDFAVLFADALGLIDRDTFDAWHAGTVQAMMEREPRLTVGWATKIINVYLKTRVYIGAQGRHHLKEMIHPPIDAGLWLGLARRFPDRPDILERTNCVTRIKDIVDYEFLSTLVLLFLVPATAGAQVTTGTSSAGLELVETVRGCRHRISMVMARSVAQRPTQLHERFDAWKLA